MWDASLRHLVTWLYWSFDTTYCQSLYANYLKHYYGCVYGNPCFQDVETWMLFQVAKTECCSRILLWSCQVHVIESSHFGISIEKHECSEFISSFSFIVDHLTVFLSMIQWDGIRALNKRGRRFVVKYAVSSMRFIATIAPIARSVKQNTGTGSYSDLYFC